MDEPLKMLHYVQIVHIKQLIWQLRSRGLLPNVLFGLPFPIAPEGKHTETEINCF